MPCRVRKGENALGSWLGKVRLNQVSNKCSFG